MTSRRAAAALFALTATLIACEIEEVAVPQTNGRVAVHAVLSPTAPAQVLLLERTRSGAVDIVAPPLEAEDPFGGGEGIAENNATVVLTAPNGTTLLAREDLTAGGAGAGIYRFSLPGQFLDRNGRYLLSITTTKGELLTAETTVPGGVSGDFAEQRVFNRSTDSIRLEWPAAPARAAISSGSRVRSARAYFSLGGRAFGSPGNCEIRT